MHQGRVVEFSPTDTLFTRPAQQQTEDYITERHISRQFDSELQALSSAFLALGGAVERQVSEALNALMEADSAQAEQVRSYRPHHPICAWSSASAKR